MLVGHSIGGLAALGAALAMPELVRGVGLYETAIPWAQWWTDDGRDAMLRETEANVAAAEDIDPSNPARDRLRMAWATCLQEVLDAFAAPFPWSELTVPVTTGFGSDGKPALGARTPRWWRRVTGPIRLSWPGPATGRPGPIRKPLPGSSGPVTSVHGGSRTGMHCCGHIAHNVRMWAVRDTALFEVRGGEAA